MTQDTAKTQADNLDLETLKTICVMSPRALCQLCVSAAKDRDLEAVRKILSAGLLEESTLSELDRLMAAGDHASVMKHTLTRFPLQDARPLIDALIDVVQRFHKKLPSSYTSDIKELAKECCEKDNVELLGYLLSIGYVPETESSVDYSSKSNILVHALEKGAFKCFRAMVDAGASVYSSQINRNQSYLGANPIAIDVILRNDFVDELAYLINSGHVDINLNTQHILFEHYRKAGNLSQRKETFPLSVACAHGSVKCVELLLNKGASVQSDYQEAMVSIARKDLIEVMEAWVYQVGGTDKAKEWLKDHEKTAKTMLTVAATHGGASVIRKLAELGMDLSRMDHDANRTPLMSAAESGQCEAFIALLECGASPDTKDHRGWTARSYAKSAKHANIISALNAFEARRKLASRMGSRASKPAA